MECTVYKKTSDIFLSYGKLNTGENVVSVSFREEYVNDYKYWLVSVDSDDDCNMSNTYNSEREAWCIFLQIIGLDDVTLLALKDIGLK